MKVVRLLIFVLFSLVLFFAHNSYAQNSPQGSSILVLIHDSTIVTSQTKRLPDKDTLFFNLDAMLNSYNVEMFDSNSTLANLGNYESVIIQETSFDATQCRYIGQAGRTALKSWLNSGTSQNRKTVIFIGGDLGYNYSRTGSAAKDDALTQTYLKYNYLLDNGTTGAQYSIVGVDVDMGNTRMMTNSPAGGGFYPDAVHPLAGGNALYRYTGRGAADTLAAVGVVETGYIGISLFQDPRYFLAGQFYQVMFSLIQYAVNNGGSFPGFVPVELTSFTASTNGTDVTLSWITATELNNQGFEIERSKDQNQWQNIGFLKGNGTTSEMKHYSYTDKDLKAGTYYYRLKQIDFDGSFEYSSVVEAEVSIPIAYELMQNYPNPFNPSTKINFSLANDSKVLLKVYNILGQEVVTLFDGELSAGSHEINFSGTNMNSGVYFYRLDAAGVNGQNFSSVKKMILNK